MLRTNCSLWEFSHADCDTQSEVILVRKSTVGVTYNAVGLPKAGIAINTASILVDIFPFAHSVAYNMLLHWFVYMGCRTAALPVSSVTFHDLWKISVWVGYCILTTQMLGEGVGRDWLWVVDMKAVSTDWWNCILVLGWIPSVEWRWETGARRLGDSLGNVGSCEIKTDRCMGVLPAPSASVRFYLLFYPIHRVYESYFEEKCEKCFSIKFQKI